MTDFSPVKDPVPRILSVFSAAITLADEQAAMAVLKLGRDNAVTGEMFYEIILQSYLFLGFPRMLTAAEYFNRFFPDHHSPAIASDKGQITPDEAERWYRDGSQLCRKVYAHNYELLKSRVEMLAPEIFRWMIIEGYGKVLSRPQLDPPTRELSIIAFLMMENREKQLFSHIKGAINVGVDKELLTIVVEDIGRSAGAGYDTTVAILRRLKLIR
ncbi:MAG: carboxymuconolactone decarboxylase family protein [Candidatus Zixiibacteriota bacterium]